MDRKQFHTAALTALSLVGLVFSHTTPADDEKGMGAPAGLKIIYVITDEQKIYAWEGNKLVHEFDVVTGRPGKETEPGVFSISRKYEDYTSKTYDAPMPYSMFFTEDGKAIHGTSWATVRSFLHTYITESVGSHGCVGLTRDEARTMFEWAPMGTRVVVLEEEPEE